MTVPLLQWEIVAILGEGQEGGGVGERLGGPEGEHGVEPFIVTMEVSRSKAALMRHFQELCILLSRNDSLHSKDNVRAARGEVEVGWEIGAVEKLAIVRWEEKRYLLKASGR